MSGCRLGLGRLRRRLMAKTINGRSSKSGRPPSDRSASTRPPSQAPSGVFRTSGGEELLEQRRWSDRWTVAEQFIRGGFYYRLLKRPVGAAGGAARLTKREGDVLHLAFAGHSNKAIAQALSVSASTVGVLLFRAAAKLGVASRNDLLKAYESQVVAQRASEPTELTELDEPDKPEG
jgi:DNA-binding CsgD family transcriptional regulator